MAPGSDKYWLGSPAVQSAVLQLDNGKTFRIETRDQSDKNVYVKKILLNGQPLTRLWLTHEEIMEGGVLVFFMSNKH